MKKGGRKLVIMDRVPTGIGGLDAIVEGGLPRNRIYTVSGTAGSGKTILCSQYLYNGAHKFSEKGLYVSFEETSEDILENLGRFDWDLDFLVKDKSLEFLYLPLNNEAFHDNMSSILGIIIEAIKKNGYKRLVLDSLPALGLGYENDHSLRKDLYLLLAELRKLECTTLLITEKASGEIGLTRYGIEDFLSHGLIMMHLTHTYRGLEVRKCRGTSHSTDINRMRISDSGISVYSGDHPY
jgi:circadian clock protein KaiC